MNIGWQELVLVFLILLLLFGPRLPDVGRSLGKGIKSFKDALAGVESEPEKADAAAGEQGKEEVVDHYASGPAEVADAASGEGEDRAG